MVPNNVYVPIFTSFVGKKEKKTNCDYFLFGLSKKRVTSTSQLEIRRIKLVTFARQVSNLSHGSSNPESTIEVGLSKYAVVKSESAIV